MPITIYPIPVQIVTVTGPVQTIAPVIPTAVSIDAAQFDDDGIPYVNPNVPGADIATGDKQTQILAALQASQPRVVTGTVSLTGPVSTLDTPIALGPNAAIENAGQLQRIADTLEAVLLELRVLSTTVQSLGQPVQDGLEQLREDLQVALN